MVAAPFPRHTAPPLGAPAVDKPRLSRPQPARLQPHLIDPERAAFYAELWGDDTGYVFVAAGLPGADLVARGWPVHSGQGEGAGADDMCMLLWTRATGDADKAAGRPHTGRVFAWPAQRAALDRYVLRLADEYENVFTRKYVAATVQDAKRGSPPATARIVQVEDAPADADPAPTFYVQTSAHKRQAYYRLATPLPWPQIVQLAEGAKLRQAGADSGGPSASQFCRIPTTRNTKARAGRWRVQLRQGGPQYTADALARAWLPGGPAELHGAPRATTRGEPGQRSAGGGGKGGPGADDPTWRADVAAAEGWRGHIWRDGALWKGGPVLRDDGTPRALKPEHMICRVLRGELPWHQAAAEWGGGKDVTGSGFTYHLVGALWRAGCPVPQIVALVEALDPAGRGKGDSWFYHQNLWGCLYRPDKGWAILCPDIPRRPLRSFTPCPAELPPAPGRRPRGRPPGRAAATDARLDALAELLATKIGALVTDPALGAALGCSTKTISRRRAELRRSDRWRVELEPERYGWRVARVDKIIAPAVEPLATGAAAQQGAPEAAEGGQETPAAEGGHFAGFTASESGDALQEDHTPLCVTPCPAPAAPGAAGDDAAPLDAEQLAELVARLEDAAALIRGERVERLHRATGEIVTHQRKATRKALAAALAELPPAHFAAAYAAWKATPWWVKEQRRLRSVELPEELYREQDGHRAALRRAGSDAPPPWAELPPERRAALVQRARSSSMRGAALVARARSEAPPAALSDAAAELLAQVQHRRAVEAHARAVRDVPRRTVLRDLVARELRRRQLPAERPGRAPIGRRAKPPTDAQVARAQAARQAELWAELDRIRARGRPAPAAAQETPARVCPPQAPPPDPAPVEAPLPPVERADLAMIARLRARLEAGKVAACAD